MPIRGVIFDLDGTLVDSGLDFDLMRREMSLPEGVSLLEAIAGLPAIMAESCRAILARHEDDGARRATLYPGVREFLDSLAQRGLARGLFTRNSRAATRATLDRLGLDFQAVMCREDGPAKPDPSVIWEICGAWGFHPSECVMVGDYIFDIEAGRGAGTRTALFTGGAQHGTRLESQGADFVFCSFVEPSGWWAWIDQIGSKSP